MAEEKKDAAKKVKRPTAQKRDLQNEKRRVRNRAYKAKVTTAVRSLETEFAQGTSESRQKSLSQIFSLVDKGVKTGKLKLNKASRVKARLTKRLKATV